MPPRYAVYFAPQPGSDLERFGTRWLGRDVVTGRLVEQYHVDGLSMDTLDDLTAEPRRYGFHGTLKPPFVLKEGKTLAQLEDALSGFASRQQRFDIAGLRLEVMGSFLALVPARPCPAMDTLAAACVRKLDLFRASPDAAELARRKKPGLTPRQLQLVDQWGSSAVMEEFRFHLTLTGLLSSEASRLLNRALPRLVSPFQDQAVAVDALCLFEQPDRNKPFRLMRRFSFPK